MVSTTWCSLPMDSLKSLRRRSRSRKGLVDPVACLAAGEGRQTGRQFANGLGNLGSALGPLLLCGPFPRPLLNLGLAARRADVRLILLFSTQLRIAVPMRPISSALEWIRWTSISSRASVRQRRSRGRSDE